MPTPVSLGVILGVLTVTTVASVLASRRDPSRRAHAGNLRGHQQDQAAAEPSCTVRR